MAQAPADDDDLDENLDTTVPEAPRRVPFGVAVTAALLGAVTVLLLFAALLTLTANWYSADGVGEAAAEGLGSAAIAVAAALVAATAWSFVRNGDTVGPLVVGGLLLLVGLIGLVAGVVSDEDTAGLRVGLVALLLGLGVILAPLLGHGPSYLAARRVWSMAEREWLHDLATPDGPAPMPHHQQQWPGQYPPQQQWGQPQQPPPQYSPQAAFPQHYQYPPQPGQLPPQPQPGQPQPVQFQPDQFQPGQPWIAPHPQHHATWPQAPVPGQPWTAQQSPAPAATPPAPAQPSAAPPQAAPQATPQHGEVPQAPVPQAPPAAAQQAPTEQIPRQDQVLPPSVPQEDQQPQQPS